MNSKRCGFFKNIALACFFTVLAGGGSATAGVKTWTGGSGSSNNWRINDNWGGNPFPVTADDVVFDGTARLTPNNNNTEIQLPYVSSIAFNSSSGAFSLAGSGYVLGIEGNVINNSSNTQTFNTLGLNLRTNVTINAAAGNITFNSGAAINGDYALTKAGEYALTLSGPKSYTGDTIVQAGTLSIDSAFLNDTAAVRITSGSTLELDFNGIDSIGGLYFDGVLQAGGTWGAPGSGADHETLNMTGSGLLKSTAGHRLSLIIISE